jgi:excisionase family DNA binding protein
MVHHTQRPIIEANRVYSREEVAEILNVSLSTVKRLIASRRLRVSQPPGMRRVLIRGQHILDLLVESEVIPTDDEAETDSAESSEAAEAAN